MVSDHLYPDEFAAFRGHHRVASGSLRDVAIALRKLLDEGDQTLVLIFNQEDGRQIDIDLGGTVEDIERRFRPTAAETTELPRGRGRPKLGVVGREVTLLPRHWEWLQTQRGGPSATLRRLVDEARSANRGRDRARQAQDAIHRFISATAGDLPGYEEATRALYRGDAERFDDEIAQWPRDVRSEVERWKPAAFDGTDNSPI